MAAFVLVHGAWHGGWCWERVAPLLEAAGHRVLAPDLLGMGSDPTPLAEVTLARWAAQIAGLVQAQTEPVILVGHSRAGIVISEAAERVPDRIARLVYLTAFLLPDGATMAGASTPERDARRRLFVRPGPGNTSTVAPDYVGPVYYNTTPAEWVERAASRLTPEPMVVFTTPLRISAERFGRVPRAYIECAQDRSISLEMQHSFQAALPCDPVITLETDHSPFYSAPEKLAEALQTIARARCDQTEPSDR